MAGIAPFQPRPAEFGIKIAGPDGTPRFLVNGVDLSGAAGRHEPVSDDLRHRVWTRPNRVRIPGLKTGFVSVLPEISARASVNRDNHILCAAMVCGIKRRAFDRDRRIAIAKRT